MSVWIILVIVLFSVVTPDTKKCSLPTPVNIYANEGYISSYVTLQTDCGLERAPWILQVASGQRLELWLLDFGALRRHNNALYVTCQQILGHIIERDIGSNITICADNERKKHLYISKTNALELVFSSDVLRTGTAGFMIQYSSKYLNVISDKQIKTPMIYLHNATNQLLVH